MVTNWATSFSHYKNTGFRLFWVLNYQFVFFLFPVICQFSKNSLFQKKGVKIGSFNFQCFKFKFWNFSCFGLLKHYKNRGFSNCWGFLLLKEKKTGKKNDNWNLWILVFLVQKWPFRDAHLLFKKRAWNPYFYSVFWVRAFWAKVSKKGNFQKPPRKMEKFDW